MANQVQRKYLYLYDLPKNDITSVKLAEIFKQNEIKISTQKPQINRDLFKPHWSAIVPLEEDFEQAKNKMKYFMIGGRAVRSLPFDQLLRGDNKKKIQDNNVFYKFPKGQDQSYDELETRFGQYGKVKSIKIAINMDHTQKGYAYICFENQEDAKKCADALADSGVLPFKPRENSNPGQKLVNNLYFKNVS